MSNAKVESAKQEVREIRLEIWALGIQREAFRNETHHRIHRDGHNIDVKREIVELNRLIGKLEHKLETEWYYKAAAALIELDDLDA